MNLRELVFDGYQELYFNYGTPLVIGLNKAGLVLSVCRYSLVFLYITND